MKTLLLDPFLAIEPANKGWFVICSPGPLATLLADLAGEGARACTITIGDNGNGRTAVAISLTPALDEALVHLVDALITLRYESGRVQFTLFSPEDVLQ